MLLTDQFNKDSIIVNSKAFTKEQAISELSSLLCDNFKISKKQQIINAVLEREKKMSTGIGCGLAIPHAKVDVVDRIHIVAMNLSEGINFMSIDKQSVFLIFLIISPTNVMGPHIRLLAFISRIMSDVKIRTRLIETTDVDDFYTTLQKGERKYG